ncbi:MAG: GTP-binding protein [Clostridia bacterium]|nr:GTP-binding protein [Clostridia bacterium]
MKAIDVFLITGFLGSGKTTLLNNMVNCFPKNKKIMILMNEFGVIGIDGTLIQGEDLNIIEINKGSIFCACVKTDFIKGLLEICQKIIPDFLLIESTGVADPSGMKRDLALPIFKGAYRFREQICVVDASNFLDTYQVFAAIEKQIKSSTRFIINKIDLVSAEEIEKIKLLIGSLHPSPSFYLTTYAKMDFEDVFQLEAAPHGPNGEGDTRPEAKMDRFREYSEEQIKKYVNELKDNYGISIQPPDNLISKIILWTGHDLSGIKDLEARFPAELIRVKGFIEIGGKQYLYNYIMGQSIVERIHADISEAQKNKLVFIFPRHAIRKVYSAIDQCDCVKRIRGCLDR